MTDSAPKLGMSKVRDEDTRFWTIRQTITSSYEAPGDGKVIDYEVSLMSMFGALFRSKPALDIVAGNSRQKDR